MLIKNIQLFPARRENYLVNLKKIKILKKSQNYFINDDMKRLNRKKMKRMKT